jgi:hypothetical protein
MNTTEKDSPVGRRVRICRPAFQDVRHVVMPRLSARAQFRRHALKLAFWSSAATRVADLDCRRIPNERMFEALVTDGFGLADGFRIIFCEEPDREPDGLICILSVMRTEEAFSSATFEILRAREVVARERLNGWSGSETW